MRYFFLIVFFLSLVEGIGAQILLPDSLQRAYNAAPNDSVKFKISRAIYTFYEETNRDSALHYAQLRYDVARKYNRKIEEAYLQGQMGYQQIYLGRFSEALANLAKAIQIATESKEEDTWELTPYSTPGRNREVTLSMINHMYGHLKLQTGSTESIYYFKEGRRIGLEIGNDFRVTVGDMVLATNYLMLNQPDSALFFAKEGEAYALKGGISKYLSYIWAVMGDIYAEQKADSLALSYYQQSLQLAKKEANFTVVSGTYVSLCNYYLTKNNADSLLHYATKMLPVVKSLGAVTSFVRGDINLGYVYQNLADGFSLKNNIDSTNKYLQLALAVKDSLTAIKLQRLAAFQRLTLDEQLRQQNEEKSRVEAEANRRMYILLAGIVVAIVIILLIYRNNRQKQKAYNLLQQQKAETDQQKSKADAALRELKSTQAQLIQSEKMASLGELTAGIAHEIQNPLNFVNNFSEVSEEMLAEAEGSRQEAGENSPLVTELLTDIKQNLAKINHHGKRADAIVKGMLQHSRSTTGNRELTNVNELVDEYVKLAFHAFRGKDNTFDVKLQTGFDPAIGAATVVPQEIGRALLNILNNAFYAVNDRKKIDPAFTPEVTVQTKKTAKSIEISVKDNGGGIRENIVGKIFQPFFTTKPTGQGTGLGLSLAYDIVKAHGGEITINNHPGEGAEFVIILPDDKRQ
jgi:two-component system NtrC family sensor kinase